MSRLGSRRDAEAGPSYSHAREKAMAQSNPAASEWVTNGEGPSPEDLTLYTTLSAYADALDALPLDLTRSFSDLRELDAVLGTHLNSLTTRLTQLTAIIESPDFNAGERLLALKEAAEEARAYKMGGEDKIRVALNTAETIISHTTYIDSLLSNLSTVPSLTPFLTPNKHPHLAGHLADGTPLAPGSGPGGNNPASISVITQESASPLKKKKSVPGHASVPPPTDKRTETHSSAQAGPNRKRKPAGTANRGRAEDSDADTTGKRPQAKRSKANGHDDDDQGSSAARSRVARNSRASGHPRGHGTDDEEEAGSDDERPARVARAPRFAQEANASVHAPVLGGEDTDEKRYCFCNNVSYGDMIGCDDDNCEREWFHLECVGLLKPPQGTWYCDDCAQKRMSRNKSKNKKIAKTSGAHGGGVVETKTRTSTTKR